MKTHVSRMNAQLCTGIMLLTVGLVFGWQVFRIHIRDSRIFPSIAVGIMVLSGIGVIIQGARGKSVLPLSSLALHKKELLLFGILVCTSPLYAVLGFYTTMLLTLLGVTSVVEYPLNKGKIRFVITYSILVDLFCYLCFSVFLGLATPSGVLI
ncbi:MAG: tripartite tricarboxylate transporter TctB family protein [Sphaerochaetaceae bacterium]